MLNDIWTWRKWGVRVCLGKVFQKDGSHAGALRLALVISLLAMLWPTEFKEVSQKGEREYTLSLSQEMGLGTELWTPQKSLLGSRTHNHVHKGTHKLKSTSTTSWWCQWEWKSWDSVRTGNYKLLIENVRWIWIWHFVFPNEQKVSQRTIILIDVYSHLNMDLVKTL